MERIDKALGRFWTEESNIEESVPGWFSYNPLEGASVTILTDIDSNKNNGGPFGDSNIPKMIRGYYEKREYLTLLNIIELEPRTKDPVSKLPIFHYEIAIKHTKDYDITDESDIKLDSIIFELEHFYQWFGSEPFKKVNEQENEEVVTIETIPAKISFRRRKKRSWSRAYDSQNLSFYTEIVINFENGPIELKKAIKWVSLFQSLTTIAAEYPANIKRMVGQYNDYSLVFYISCTDRLGQPDEVRYSDNQFNNDRAHIYDYQMNFTFADLVSNGIVKLIDGEKEIIGVYDITNHKFDKRYGQIYGLANGHFMGIIPLKYRYLDLFTYCENMCADTEYTKANAIMEKIVESSEKEIKKILLGDHFECWFDDLLKFRNSIAHNKVSSEEKEPTISEQLLYLSLRIIAIRYFFNSLIRKKHWYIDKKEPFYNQKEYWAQYFKKVFGEIKNELEKSK